MEITSPNVPINSPAIYYDCYESVRDLSSVLRTNFELDLKSSVGHVSIAEGSEEDHHLIVLRFDCLSQRLITTEPRSETVINQSSKIDISTMPTPAYSQAMRLATLATL